MVINLQRLSEEDTESDPILSHFITLIYSLSRLLLCTRGARALGKLEVDNVISGLSLTLVSPVI